MYLTVVMLSKPLETSTGLNWDWFCESNWNLFEIVQEHEIFRYSFFSVEKGRVEVVYFNNDF